MSDVMYWHAICHELTCLISCIAMADIMYWQADLNLETIRITESKTEANEIRIVAETMQLAPTNEAGSKPLLRQVANKVSSVGLR